jgi:hypothetical protein
MDTYMNKKKWLILLSVVLGVVLLIFSKWYYDHCSAGMYLWNFELKCKSIEKDIYDEYILYGINGIDIPEKIAALEELQQMKEEFKEEFNRKWGGRYAMYYLWMIQYYNGIERPIDLLQKVDELPRHHRESLEREIISFNSED